MSWKEKWLKLPRLQQVLLVLLAGMILVFTGAMPIIASRKGIAYSGTLLYFRQDGDVRRYAGKVDGEKAAFAVYPDGTVTYAWGKHSYGPYQVVAEDASAALARLDFPGIEIRRGDEVLFRGSYHSGSFPMLFGEDGEPWFTSSFPIIGVSGGEGTVVMNGKVVTQAEMHEPSLTTLAELVLDPQLTCRGDVSIYLITTVMAVVVALGIWFYRELFRWNLSWTVRDPDDAEPSEWYIFWQKFSWVFCTGAVAVFYIIGLIQIN